MAIGRAASVLGPKDLANVRSMPFFTDENRRILPMSARQWPFSAHHTTLIGHHTHAHTHCQDVEAVNARVRVDVALETWPPGAE